MDHGAEAFGPPEFRYTRKLVIISQFQASVVIQAKKCKQTTKLTFMWQTGGEG